MFWTRFIEFIIGSVNPYVKATGISGLAEELSAAGEGQCCIELAVVL